MLPIFALLIAYAPGALFYRLPWWDRDRRAALDAEERVFWHVIISLVWSTTAVLTLAWFEVYRFERLLAINAGIVAVMALAGRHHLAYDGTAKRPGISVLWPAALVALGASLYLPPSEYVMGGKDPGAYMNEGIQIAQRGTLLIHDPVVAGLPPTLADLFFPSYRDPNYYSVRFMGFWVQDPRAGTVIGQFPHLFPASIAIGYGLNGLSGARQTVVVWAVLGLVALYLLGARLIGRPAAAAAAGLLAINVITVWFARYPNAEQLAQVWLLAGLLAFARVHADGIRFLAPWAALLIGLQMFLRYDTVLAIAAVVAAWSGLAVVRRRVGVGFWVALLGTSAAGLWYLAGPMRGYAAYPLAYTQQRGGWVLVGLAAAAVVLFRVLARSDRVAASMRTWIPAMLVAALAVLAIYAGFFREAGGRTAEPDAMAFRVFAWYLTPWGLALACGGLLLLTWRRFWTAPAFFLTVATYSVFFFYKTRITPEHFFAMRRVLTITLPAVLLGAAALAAWLAARVTRRREAEPAGATRPETPATGVAAGAISFALLAPLAVVFWQQAAPVRAHVEYAGLIPRLEELAASFTPRDLVIVESRNASDTHVLALPLAYIYDRQVAVLSNPSPDKRRVELILDWAVGRYDRVFFLGGGGTDLRSRRIEATAIRSWQFSIPEYDAPRHAYPTGVRYKQFDFGLYQLGLSAGIGEAPADVTVGTLDELDVIRVHAKEKNADGQAFRWTRDVSYVLLGRAGASTREVVVWMGDGGRPAAAPPADVEVAIGETTLGRVRVEGDPKPYVFAVPAAVAAAMGRSLDPARLQLRTTPWSPSALTGGGDTRELGVMLTRVETR